MRSSVRADGGGVALEENSTTMTPAAHGPLAQSPGPVLWCNPEVLWIDSHCHLDAPEFDPDRPSVLAAARAAGVGMLVLPAVQVADFEALRALAHRHRLAYALGIHPLFADRAAADDLDRLAEALDRWRDDPHLVAVGEIGLDHFVPGLDLDRQRELYRAQLALARDAGLPVILHVRRSADALLAGLARTPVVGGIAHAFNGSPAQAARLLDRGLRLGFGGTLSFERALRIRALARTLPDDALVLETDAPDIPPQWLYRTAEQRRDAPQARNVPAELPRIGAVLAALRGWTVEQTAARTAANAVAALPRLQGLLA
jgi:TatD DNase family protein